MVDRSAGIVCDAKSGVSGAGRKASLKTSFCEVTENFSAYSVLDHRHVAEVLMVSGLEEPEFSFTAHLLPIDRGILETIYLRTRNIKSAEDLLDIYLRHYQPENFVRLYQPGSLPDLAAVERTNFCDIGVTFDAATGRAVIVSAIDNLVKGAAGQAIQNMNLMLGCEETAGPAVRRTCRESTHQARRHAARCAGIAPSPGVRNRCGGQARPPGRRRARRRQANDALPGRARHREPLRERPARHHAGSPGRRRQSLGWLGESGARSRLLSRAAPRRSG